MRDVRTGRESLIPATGKLPFLNPILSQDGTRVAYLDAPEARTPTLGGGVKLASYIAGVDSMSRSTVCDMCVVLGFFPDSDQILVSKDFRLWKGRPGGEEQVLLTEVPRIAGPVTLSPDAKWVTITKPTQSGNAALYLVDITRPPIRPESWKLVAEDRQYLGNSAWSPDSRMLYYVSQRDGSLCAWAQAVGPDGKLAGPAKSVLHLHSGNGVMGADLSIGVTHDRLYVLLDEVLGDVYSLQLEQ